MQLTQQGENLEDYGLAVVSTKEPAIEGVVSRKEAKNYFQEDKRKEKTAAYYCQEKEIKKERMQLSVRGDKIRADKSNDDVTEIK